MPPLAFDPYKHWSRSSLTSCTFLKTTDSATTETGKSAALILATRCSANLMATMDVFVVNVSLHSTGVGFGGEKLSNVSWVLSAYAIVFGALLVPAGRFADRYGKKGSFLLGLSLFTVALRTSSVRPSRLRAPGRCGAVRACHPCSRRSHLGDGV